MRGRILTVAIRSRSQICSFIPKSSDIEIATGQRVIMVRLKDKYRVINNLEQTHKGSR